MPTGIPMFSADHVTDFAPSSVALVRRHLGAVVALRSAGVCRHRAIGIDRRRQGHRQTAPLPHAPGRAEKTALQPDKVPFWHDHFVLPGKILLKLPLGNYTFRHRTRA